MYTFYSRQTARWIISILKQFQIKAEIVHDIQFNNNESTCWAEQNVYIKLLLGTKIQPYWKRHISFIETNEKNKIFKWKKAFLQNHVSLCHGMT